MGLIIAAYPAAGFMADKIGRKRSMMVLSFPLFIGWLIVAFADSIILLEVGRFITGEEPIVRVI